MQISQLLATINWRLALFADTSNRDVLQAVSMLFAGMGHADRNTVARLLSQLLSTALDAIMVAHCQVPQTGHTRSSPFKMEA